MFQTLVNIEARKRFIWKRILKDNYSDELCLEYASMVSQNIINRFHEEFSKSHEFMNLRCIFEGCFANIFELKGVEYDPKVATQIFIEEHNNAEWYEDSLSFIEKANSQYKVCLVSDADYDMVFALLEKIRIDKVVISEEVRSYKRNADGKMFEEVLKHYQCKPDEILHIGDSSSDIVGAKSQNIDTCWINRHNYKKRFEGAPTYEVESLYELEKELFNDIVY